MMPERCYPTPASQCRPADLGRRRGSLDELDLEAWRRFVESSRSSTIFHSPEWIAFVSEHYQIPLRIFALRHDREILAAIPFIETRTLRRHRKLLSLPFSDLVPVLSRDSASREALLQSLRSSAVAEYDSVAIRSPESLPGLPSSSDWVDHTLTIPHDYSSLSKGFSGSLRRNIRKAEARGLEFATSTQFDAIDTFYELHVLTRRKLGVPVQTKRFFRDLHERIISKELGFIGLVRDRNTAIAAAVFLHYNETMTYKYGASHPGRLECRPNDLLFANVLRLAIEKSCRRFDFGVSGKGDLGLRRFKLKWGSQERPVAHCYIKGLPEPNEDLPGLRRLASIVIRSAPTCVCRGLGAAFYRYSQ
jgi:CelD/BcsL family acetyltransferase involved in cellulose biosynthesis